MFTSFLCYFLCAFVHNIIGRGSVVFFLSVAVFFFRKGFCATNWREIFSLMLDKSNVRWLAAKRMRSKLNTLKDIRSAVARPNSFRLGRRQTQTTPPDYSRRLSGLCFHSYTSNSWPLYRSLIKRSTFHTRVHALFSWAHNLLLSLFFFFASPHPSLGEQPLLTAGPVRRLNSRNKHKAKHETSEVKRKLFKRIKQRNKLNTQSLKWKAKVERMTWSANYLKSAARPNSVEREWSASKTMFWWFQRTD